MNSNLIAGSMPITASFGRSSVAAASGVRSTMSNIYAGTHLFQNFQKYSTVYLPKLILTGVLVLLALGFLMPSLAYIPKAVLAAVIITSVVFMVELSEVKHLWKSRSKF